ncbi:MAG: bacteriohemerythrin [Propionivibrio sp.]
MADDLMSWKAQYNLGLDEIDAQHRSLLELINKAWRAIVRRSDQSVVLALIEELEKYTLAHFAAEETFMRATEYPAFDEHKREHNAFIARVADEKRRALATGTLSLDLMHFLRDWLIDHIVVSDRAYADFTQENKARRKSLLGRLFTRFF